MPGAPTPVGGADTPGPVTMNLNPEQARDFHGDLDPGVAQVAEKFASKKWSQRGREGRFVFLFVAGGD